MRTNSQTDMYLVYKFTEVFLIINQLIVLQDSEVITKKKEIEKIHNCNTLDAEK